jgi:hypothetical protein
MITVLSGGDSFVWGSELSDSLHGGNNGFSRKTFPSLLADNYICAAYPGIGNKEITKRVKEMLFWANPDIVIVCWTWPSRDNDLDSDRYIEELQHNLEYYHIPFLFTCADNCVITGDINYENWFMFPPGSGPDQTESPRGFYQWAVENKYKVGLQHHPLEHAHVDAANLMKDKFNELVKKHLVQNKIRNSI